MSKKMGLTVVLIMAALTAHRAGGATLLEWDGSSSVTWTTAANWAGDIAPANTISSTTGHIARFRSNPISGRMPTVSSTRSINGLRFDYNANYAQWAVNGGSSAVLSVGSGGISNYGGATVQLDLGINFGVSAISYHEAGGTVIFKQEVTSTGTLANTMTLSGAAGGISQIHGNFNPAANVMLNRTGGGIRLAANNLQVALAGNGFDGRLQIMSGSLDLNGYSATAGALDLEGTNAALNFGTGGTNSVSFLNSSEQDWGEYMIDILNYNTSSPTSIRFGTNAAGLTSSQLSQLVFKGIGTGGVDIVGGSIDSLGYVIPVPEPATMCLLALGGLFVRKRSL